MTTRCTWLETCSTPFHAPQPSSCSLGHFEISRTLTSSSAWPAMQTMLAPLLYDAAIVAYTAAYEQIQQAVKERACCVGCRWLCSPRIPTQGCATLGTVWHHLPAASWQISPKHGLQSCRLVRLPACTPSAALLHGSARGYSLHYPDDVMHARHRSHQATMRLCYLPDLL